MTSRRPGGLRLPLVLSASYMVFLVAISFLAPFVAPHNPVRQDTAALLAKPGTAGHILGTDDLGRDVLSRIIYGSRSALMVGVIASFGSSLVGSVIGLSAGMLGGFWDGALMMLTDSILAFPTILAAMIAVAVFGFGLGPVTIALVIAYSPVFARLVRTETQAVKAEGFVVASRALGFRAPWIIARHIIPNIAGKVIVQMATVFALAVSVEASLSYLGLGIQPPDASWGLMLKDARNYMAMAPWLAIYPGLAVFLTVLAATVLGNELSRNLAVQESHL